MNTLSPHPSASTRPNAPPSGLLVARPSRQVPSQHPPTWEDLLGRR